MKDGMEGWSFSLYDVLTMIPTFSACIEHQVSREIGAVMETVVDVDHRPGSVVKQAILDPRQWCTPCEVRATLFFPQTKFAYDKLAQDSAPGLVPSRGVIEIRKPQRSHSRHAYPGHLASRNGGIASTATNKNRVPVGTEKKGIGYGCARSIPQGDCTSRSQSPVPTTGNDPE